MSILMAGFRLGVLPTLAALLSQPLAAAEAGDQQLGQPPPYVGTLPSLAAVNERDARLEEIVTDLSEPWAFEFIDSNEVIITEIRGRLLRYHLTDRRIREISGLPPIATDRNQTGLLDVEAHPRFADNQRIYLSYTVADPETGKYFMTEVSTARLVGDHLEGLAPIVPAKSFGWSPANFGGALEFDAEGYLYVTIGDRSQGPLAQQGEYLEGKLLRLQDDGSVPEDNPFVGVPGVDPRIYALGLRNAQGLHFDAPSGRMFMAEHGPMGGDEINLVEAGANYGWPTITYGRSYTTARIGVGTQLEGMTQPLFYYLPAEAISPLTVYRGGMFPAWDGHLLVGALKGKHVSKLDLDGTRVRSEYPIIKEVADRVRDVKVALDGSVYVLVQGGTLFRLYQGESVPEKALEPPTGKAFYDLVCAGCHDTGANNAPTLNDAQRWREIASEPRQAIYLRTFEGFGDMPERGMCFICNDDQLRMTVDYMLEEGQSD